MGLSYIIEAIQETKSKIQNPRTRIQVLIKPFTSGFTKYPSGTDNVRREAVDGKGPFGSQAMEGTPGDSTIKSLTEKGICPAHEGTKG